MMMELLIVLGIIAVLGECCIIGLWFIAYWKIKKTSFPHFTPFASVLIPCKTVDQGFHENIHAFLSQDYARYDLFFIVDSSEDPVYEALNKYIQERPNVHLIITKPISTCSGKVAALLSGLESISADVEVLVFADSDIKPDTHWLENIIAPLQDDRIGATTGYRWYFPTNLKSVLISAWNMSSIIFMFFPRFSFTWGGSTAIRKIVFDDLAIKEKWNHAFSDDLVITVALKKAGYKIFLQPKCIIESPPEANIHRFIKWGTRQYTWVRWYYPLFWFSSFFGYIGVQILIGVGLLLLLLGFYLPGVILCSILLFELLYGWVGITILPKTMLYPRERYHSRSVYAFLTPVVFFLLALNIIASATKREIEWAGRVYRKPKNIDHF